MRSEIWKDINGYKGFYQISNLGRVFSIRSSKIMKTHKNSGGYPIVVFSVKGKRTRQLVHRLVANEFVENKNPQRFKIVNHIDEDKTNPRYDNLEWCDKSHNMYHSMYRMKFKLNSPVIQLDLNGNFVKEYINVGSTPFYSKELISACFEEKEYKGYLWKYKNELKRPYYSSWV